MFNAQRGVLCLTLVFMAVMTNLAEGQAPNGAVKGIVYKTDGSKNTGQDVDIEVFRKSDNTSISTKVKSLADATFSCTFDQGKVAAGGLITVKFTRGGNTTTIDGLLGNPSGGTVITHNIHVVVP